MYVYICVCERENRDTRCIDTENTQVKCILTKEKDSTYTKWEEGALYSHPLSSLNTRHIKHGNVEAHKLGVIKYD